jgi:protein-disulfide isomerase
MNLISVFHLLTPWIVWIVMISMSVANDQSHNLTKPMMSISKEGAVCVGDPKAPHELVMYYSLTCPHCAHYEHAHFNEFQKTLIKNKVMRFCFYDFPLDKSAILATLMANCFGVNNYVPISQNILYRQDEWKMSKHADVILLKIASELGLDHKKIHRCWNDRDAKVAILKRQLYAKDKYGIDYAPAFVLDGNLIDYKPTVAILERIFFENR